MYALLYVSECTNAMYANAHRITLHIFVEHNKLLNVQHNKLTIVRLLLYAKAYLLLST